MKQEKFPIKIWNDPGGLGHCPGKFLSSYNDVVLLKAYEKAEKQIFHHHETKWEF